MFFEFFSLILAKFSGKNRKKRIFYPAKKEKWKKMRGKNAFYRKSNF
jgi:hypothetical protein